MALQTQEKRLGRVAQSYLGVGHSLDPALEFD